MNWKLVVVGGLVFYVVMLIVSFVTGPLIHERVLDEAYRENADFWQPALQQDPPDMASLMPRWIISGVIGSLILAAIYGCIRPAFSGPGWRRGLWYGLILCGFGIVFFLGWSGMFYLPNKIWIWWSVEQFFYYLPAGAALGAVAQKLAP